MLPRLFCSAAFETGVVPAGTFGSAALRDRAVSVPDDDDVALDSVSGLWFDELSLSSMTGLREQMK